jgi:membrane associated rhomboid family serine protease
VLTNLILFAICNHWDQVREQRIAERGITALVYFHQHPYLTLKSPLNEFVARNGADDSSSRHHATAMAPSFAVLGSLSMAVGNSPAPDDWRLVSRQQAELDSKVGAFAEIADEWQVSSLGYVPRTHQWWTLFSYQFIHGSWLHLIGNLCFLLFVGVRLERSWGSTLFAAFYIASGVAAAGAHQFLAWPSMVPLIGASGSIAGLLGAYTLQQANLYHRTNRLWAMRWSRRQLYLPILLMVWCALELLQALVGLRRVGGVAHLAHVGGFGFGLIGAWLLRMTPHGVRSPCNLDSG